MGDPEFRTDETVLLRTPGVYVKSIPFEGILTTKRIILVDRAKNLLPPKEIPLATIKSAEGGENAIRDQILTLTVMARTGDTRQMILTFSRQEGGNRIKERDEWLRQIQANLGASFENVIRKVIPGADTVPRKAEPAPQPRISVVSSPVPPVQPQPVYRQPAAQPVPPAYPPAESAPAAGTIAFCSRCGNKVPAESAFCNRCGSPIVAPPTTPAPAQQVPVYAPPVPAAAPVPAPAPQRPIDRDIQTIEPLIERSTERIPADPLRGPLPDVPIRQSRAWDDETEDVAATQSPAPESPVQPAPAQQPAEKKGFLPKLFSAKARTPSSPAPVAQPAVAPPVPAKPGRSFRPGRNTIMAIGAVVVVLVLVAIGALFVYPMISSGNLFPSSESGSPSPTPTSSGSSATTPLTADKVVIKETPAVTIPPTGIYVHVNYVGGFKGNYGMPDALTVVPGNSGDRIWEVENANGTVVAEFEKLDGSSHEILVEIYKNGAVLATQKSAVGHGSVKLSIDAAGGIPQASSGTAGGTTASSNTTISSTKPVTTTTTSAKNTSTTTAKP